MHFFDFNSAQCPDSVIMPARVLLLLPSTGKPITLSQTLADNLLETLYSSQRLNAFYHRELDQFSQNQTLIGRSAPIFQFSNHAASN